METFSVKIPSARMKSPDEVMNIEIKKDVDGLGLIYSTKLLPHHLQLMRMIIIMNEFFAINMLAINLRYYYMWIH